MEEQKQGEAFSPYIRARSIGLMSFKDFAEAMEIMADMYGDESIQRQAIGDGRINPKLASDNVIHNHYDVRAVGTWNDVPYAVLFDRATCRKPTLVQIGGLYPPWNVN